MGGANNNNHKVVPIREKDPFYKELLGEERFDSFLKQKLEKNKAKTIPFFKKRGMAPEFDNLKEVLDITERWSNGGSRWKADSTPHPAPSRFEEKEVIESDESPTMISPLKWGNLLWICLGIFSLSILILLFYLAPWRSKEDKEKWMVRSALPPPEMESRPEETEHTPLAEDIPSTLLGVSDIKGKGEAGGEASKEMQLAPPLPEKKGVTAPPPSIERQLFVREGDSLSALSLILNFPHRPLRWNRLDPQEVVKVEETMKRIIELNREHLLRLNPYADPENPYTFNTILKGEFLVVERDSGKVDF